MCRSGPKNIIQSLASNYSFDFIPTILFSTYFVFFFPFFKKSKYVTILEHFCRWLLCLETFPLSYDYAISTLSFLKSLTNWYLLSRSILSWVYLKLQWHSCIYYPLYLLNFSPEELLQSNILFSDLFSLLFSPNLPITSPQLTISCKKAELDLSVFFHSFPLVPIIISGLRSVTSDSLWLSGP